MKVKNIFILIVIILIGIFLCYFIWQKYFAWGLYSRGPNGGTMPEQHISDHISLQDCKNAALKDMRSLSLTKGLETHFCGKNCNIKFNTFFGNCTEEEGFYLPDGSVFSLLAD